MDSEGPWGDQAATCVEEGSASPAVECRKRGRNGAHKPTMDTQNGEGGGFTCHRCFKVKTKCDKKFPCGRCARLNYVCEPRMAKPGRPSASSRPESSLCSSSSSSSSSSPSSSAVPLPCSPASSASSSPAPSPLRPTHPHAALTLPPSSSSSSSSLHAQSGAVSLSMLSSVGEGGGSMILWGETVGADAAMMSECMRMLSGDAEAAPHAYQPPSSPALPSCRSSGDMADLGQQQSGPCHLDDVSTPSTASLVNSDGPRHHLHPAPSPFPPHASLASQGKKLPPDASSFLAFRMLSSTDCSHLRARPMMHGPLTTRHEQQQQAGSPCGPRGGGPQPQLSWMRQEQQRLGEQRPPHEARERAGGGGSREQETGQQLEGGACDEGSAKDDRQEEEEAGRESRDEQHDSPRQGRFNEEQQQREGEGGRVGEGCGGDHCQPTGHRQGQQQPRHPQQGATLRQLQAASQQQRLQVSDRMRAAAASHATQPFSPSPSLHAPATTCTSSWVAKAACRPFNRPKVTALLRSWQWRSQLEGGRDVTGGLLHRLSAALYVPLLPPPPLLPLPPTAPAMAQDAGLTRLVQGLMSEVRPQQALCCVQQPLTGQPSLVASARFVALFGSMMEQPEALAGELPFNHWARLMEAGSLEDYWSMALHALLRDTRVAPTTCVEVCDRFGLRSWAMCRMEAHVSACGRHSLACILLDPVSAEGR